MWLDSLINRIVEWISDILAKWPGLLPILGLGFILLNLVLQIYPGAGHWYVDLDLFLHMGLLAAILGILLFRPLG